MQGLTLAIPSKGRLEQDSRAAFEAAGLRIERPGGARAYIGSSVRQPDLAIRFMPATEIARELTRGTIDLGITGTDLIEEVTESSADHVLVVKSLGNGTCIPCCCTRRHDLEGILRSKNMREPFNDDRLIIDQGKRNQFHKWSPRALLEQATLSRKCAVWEIIWERRRRP